MPKNNISKFLTLPSTSRSCALPFDFKLERDPKNIFYYQSEEELHGSGPYTWTYTWNLPVCNSGQCVYVTSFMLSLLLKIWLIESVLIFRKHLFRENCFLLASKIQHHKVFGWKQEVGDNLNSCVQNILL